MAVLTVLSVSVVMAVSVMKATPPLKLNPPFSVILNGNHFGPPSRTQSALTQNRLQQGRSNLVDPARWPKIGLLNRDFGSIFCQFFLGKRAKHRVH